MTLSKDVAKLECKVEALEKRSSEVESLHGLLRWVGENKARALICLVIFFSVVDVSVDTKDFWTLLHHVKELIQPWI